MGKASGVNLQKPTTLRQFSVFQHSVLLPGSACDAADPQTVSAFADSFDTSYGEGATHVGTTSFRPQLMNVQAFSIEMIQGHFVPEGDPEVNGLKSTEHFFFLLPP